jgi:hypothetical protein
MRGQSPQLVDFAGTAEFRLIPFGQHFYAFRKALETGLPGANHGFCQPPQRYLPIFILPTMGGEKLWLRQQALWFLLKFGQFQEIDEIEIQPRENHIGHLEREQLLPLQYIMEMRLGDTDHSGKAALGRFTAPDPVPKVSDQTHLELGKSHHNL